MNGALFLPHVEGWRKGLSDLLGPMSSLSVFGVSGYLDLCLKVVIVQEESCGVYVYGVLCSIVRIIEKY